MTVNRWLVTGLGVAVLAVFAASAAAQAQVKYVKYDVGGTTSWGILENDTTIQALSGMPWAGGKPTGRRVKLAEVKLLAPAEPKKVIAAGLNYKSHIGQASPAKYVGLFAKFPTSLIGHEADIVYPADATNLHYEAEICVVIGKKAQNITEAQVKEHIFGVTPCNDVSERNWQRDDLQWFRAKAADTFGPMGPALVSNVDYSHLKLIGRHNGQVVQETTTDLLIFNINNIVSYTSRYITLEPGDVIFTGTPEGVGPVKPGDRIEGSVEGVGTIALEIAPAR